MEDSITFLFFKTIFLTKTDVIRNCPPCLGPTGPSIVKARWTDGQNIPCILQNITPFWAPPGPGPPVQAPWPKPPGPGLSAQAPRPRPAGPGPPAQAPRPRPPGPGVWAQAGRPPWAGGPGPGGLGREWNNVVLYAFYKSIMDGRTDGPTDRWTDTPSYRDGSTHLEMNK